MAITGPAIQHAEIARLVASLGIEITTGLRHSRGSQMELARKWCGSSKRTKKGMLEDLVVWFYANGGDLHNLWGTVNRALGEDRAAKLKRRATKGAPVIDTREAAK